MHTLRFAIAFFAACATAFADQPATQPTTSPTQVETIVILRHGEKPPGGQGNLSAQGLNRAIALSTVLPKMFGKPTALFAPDPGERVADPGGLANYVRPLMTIDPTAIVYGMPVHTPCGYRDYEDAAYALTRPPYENGVLFVAWEHGAAVNLAKQLMHDNGGEPTKIPSWAGEDYDSLYVITITRAPGEKPKAKFVHQQEGLDNLSKEMPTPAK